MTKPEQNACLSTFESKPLAAVRSSHPPPLSPLSTSAPAFSEPMSVMDDEGKMQRQRQRRTQAQVQMEMQLLANRERAPEERHSSSSSSRARPDYLLVSCLVLIYLELSWLILMLLRTYSRH